MKHDLDLFDDYETKQKNIGRGKYSTFIKWCISLFAASYFLVLYGLNYISWYICMSIVAIIFSYGYLEVIYEDYNFILLNVELIDILPQPLSPRHRHLTRSLMKSDE